VRADEVTAIFDELGGCEINAYGWTWGPIRIERGGGIAGHCGDYWIKFPGAELNSIGPFRSKRHLRQAIRNLLVASIKTATACLDFHNAVSGDPSPER
jgi:hypothetical protein